MRKYLLAGNWKMNTNLFEGISLFEEIQKELETQIKPDPALEVIICPPFTHLYSLQAISKSQVTPSKISLGAQNCASEPKGAFTGEVAAGMLKSLEIKYIILGHSERRHYFGETPEILSKKVDLVLENQLCPIFCIGETLKERESGNYLNVIESQLSQSLFHLKREFFHQIILAYEPVWAIGTGLTASPTQAQEVHQFIRKKMVEKYSMSLADELTILYGGSCNEKNAQELFSQKDIDGGLIGGASLKPKEFGEMAKILELEKIGKRHSKIHH